MEKNITSQIIFNYWQVNKKHDKSLKNIFHQAFVISYIIVRVIINLQFVKKEKQC